MAGFLIRIEAQMAPFGSQCPPGGTKKVPFWPKCNWTFEVSAKVDSGVVSAKRQIRVEVEIVTKTGPPQASKKYQNEKNMKMYLRIIKKEVIDLSMLF